MIKRNLSIALLAAMAIGAGVANSAQTDTRAVVRAHQPEIAELSADTNQLLLRSGAFDPIKQRLDLQATGAKAAINSRYAIVQFNSGMLDQRKRLEKLGVVFLGYIPNNAYQVRLDKVDLDVVRADAAVRWAGNYDSGYKLDPTLWTSARGSLKALVRSENAAATYRINVHGFDGESAQALSEALKKIAPQAQIDIITAHSDALLLRVELAPDQLDAFLAAAPALDAVSWVAPFVQQQVVNTGSIGTIQGNFVGACSGTGATLCGNTPLWDHGLLGTGQIVEVSDSGTTPNMAFFTTLNGNTAITVADNPAPTLPAVGLSYPNNKILAYWVQPGATAYDNTKTCPGGSANSFHGTHTTTTTVGDAAGTFGANTYIASTSTAPGHEVGDGMAPNAQLLFQDIGNDTSGCLAINDLRGTLKQSFSGGARINSASWGSADYGVYAGDDSNVDYSLSTLEDLIFVVAAGNDGVTSVANGCPALQFVGGVCTSSVGSPGNAKNAITVGALGHGGSTTIANFSSRGPTSDGRIKPDIMAPGSSIISGAGNVNVTGTAQAPATKSLSGTSMATPTIAGNAALMRQFFSDGFYPRGAKTSVDTLNPSGMVMKVVLLNGTGTNYNTAAEWSGMNFGWGRAWLDSNLWFSTTTTGTDARRMRLFERTNAAGLKTGDSNQYTIANVQAGQELRATLTWYDPEASLGAALTLVNNLDLEVEGPGATLYKGNVFSSGISVTGGSADSKNTVEQVRITVPVAGSYTFRVKATSVPGGSRINTARQGYALAVSGAFGLPDQAAFPAPTAVVVAANDAINGVTIGFNAAVGAQGFQLYRAAGTCASAIAGDFRLVGDAATSPIADKTAQGGFSYAYKVRGVQNDVEGDVSGCVDVTSQNTCGLQPQFDEVSILDNGVSSTCQVNFSWNAASANCPTNTGITYNVQRDNSPYFTAPTTLISGLAATSYTDTAVSSGLTQYYGVQAVDSFGNASNHLRTIAATPLSPAGLDGNTYFDNAITHSYMQAAAPWQNTNSAASVVGGYSYHTGGDGLNYPDLSCAAITTPPILVQAGAALSFKAKYDFEYQWDGIVMEISTDGGSTWTDLPPDGGYPSTFAQTTSPPVNACGYIATHGAFTGVSVSAANNHDAGNGTSVAAFLPFSKNLSAYAGQTIKLRWVLSSDPGADFAGGFIDQITLGGNALDRIFSSDFEGGPDFTCH
ncbi:hypothetical protein ELE36_16045 [Pseudolysobacter antarcticus]|uniref:Peptidase S8/S53 domain-containing protein n=1 Tax=Pseudolysobacter antarcticus TaxID=2511995 RepID=A0A411HMN7_9GAMM|nr:S8 family serine peptidase [Pseudolysobacter antarcticus]QBB71743.1 hypothetical protein ELE36_16045 [Pseudolysobacter antarcticus]